MSTVLSLRLVRRPVSGWRPTGGIDLDNFEQIVQIALDAGVTKIIPHIYSSIIDSKTGNTRPADVKILLDIVKKIVP